MTQHQMDSSNITLIVVSAGTGSRFGSDVPKQYLDIHTPDGDMPVIIATLSRFAALLQEAQILVVVSEMWQSHMTEELDRFGLSDRVEIIAGGATRTESVSNALAAVKAGCQYIGVHDGVRPIVPRDVVMEALEAVKEGAEGAIPVIDVTDSLRELQAEGDSAPVDRARYKAVQTPQFFPAKLLIEAYRTRAPKGTFTDDASVLAAAGHTDMRLTHGSPYNIKITHPLDIKIAEIYSLSSTISAQ